MIKPEATDLVLPDDQHQKLLSDHTPVVQAIPGYGTGMIWNILTKCRATRTPAGRIRKNNAFGIQETPEQYASRLARISEEIGKLTEKQKVEMSIIALQEVPPPLPTFHDSTTPAYQELLRNRLSKALGKHWRVEEAPYLAMHGHKFGNLLLINSHYFSSYDDVTLRTHIGSQQGRALVIDLMAREKKLTPLRFANVHFNWDKLVRFEVKYAIERLVKTADEQPLVIAGDFNTEHNYVTLENLENVRLIPQDIAQLKETSLRCHPGIDFFILANLPEM